MPKKKSKEAAPKAARSDAPSASRAKPSKPEPAPAAAESPPGPAPAPAPVPVEAAPNPPAKPEPSVVEPASTAKPRGERYELRPRRVAWSAGASTHGGELRDISDSGGMVVLDEGAPPAPGISIRLSLPAKGALLSLRPAASTTAVVRWVGKSGTKPAFGVSFTGDAESRRKLLFDALVHD